MRLAVLVGSPRSASRTLAVATAAAAAVARRAGLSSGYEVVDLSTLARRLLLVVMNSPEHARAADAYLRPLLTELGATVPAPALAVLESDLGPPDDVLEAWARQVTGALWPAAGRGHHRPDGSVAAMAAGRYSTVTGR